MHKPAVLVASLIVAGALAAGVAGPVAAEEDSFADHPLTGTWLAMANPPLPDDPQVAAPSYFGADGSVLLMFPLSQVGPGGVQFNSAGVGTWEPDGERRGHFTVVEAFSDAEGTYLGTLTIDGYPVVSEDGQTFVDDGSKVMGTIRDAAGTIVQQFSAAGGRPINAIRMAPGAPGFPESPPVPAGPAAPSPSP